ncbi:hypothetical protein BpHYR1_040469 [Brachionus plicatilis]|uniref:Uncharacterized protein n=1 Tax=Brachionus plicatilis TaxID=10195 RepID=A0A3M7RE92_BRAPC|nr:hypothetical protein BpHYR1_040469 [Brachionus plicatilis]
MRLSVSEREAFRKAFKKIISQMTKSDLVAYFTKQGIARGTIYNAINRIQIGDPLLNFLNPIQIEKKLSINKVMVFFRFLCVQFINSSIYIHECLNKRLLIEVKGIRLKFCEIPYGGGQSKAQKN